MTNIDRIVDESIVVRYEMWNVIILIDLSNKRITYQHWSVFLVLFDFEYWKFDFVLFIVFERKKFIKWKSWQMLMSLVESFFFFFFQFVLLFSHKIVFVRLDWFVRHIIGHTIQTLWLHLICNEIERENLLINFIFRCYERDKSDNKWNCLWLICANNESAPVLCAKIHDIFCIRSEIRNSE